MMPHTILDTGSYHTFHGETVSRVMYVPPDDWRTIVELAERDILAVKKETAETMASWVHDAQKVSPAAPSNPNGPCYPRTRTMGGKGDVSISGCHCTPFNAAPTTLPWDDFVAYDQDVVNALGIIFKQHTPAKMAKMAPYFEEQCVKHDTSPHEVSVTLAALNNLFVDGNRQEAHTSSARFKALCVAVEMHGMASAQVADSLVAKGRQLDWVRLIEFSGDAALAALLTAGVTTTAAAAAYMTAHYAAGQWVTAKGTLCLATKLKCAGVAAAAGVGAAALGVATGVAAVGSVGWWYGTIQAFRDVWDNEFARDAYTLHKLRAHAVAPGLRPACNHDNGEWTSPNTRLVSKTKRWKNN